MSSVRTLVVGESWHTVEYHTKGFDTFSNATYTEAVDDLREALESDGIEVTYQPCHVAAGEFPEDADSLAQYDVVVLSDVGYNTLAIPPATFSDGERRADRLSLLESYVRAGGGLAMIGGYLSFQGIEAKANYAGTPVERALPVRIQRHDDRVERPDGAQAAVLDPEHPVTAEIEGPWPAFLGYNRFEPADGADRLVDVADDPLLVVGDHGEGRSAAFASDCAPHWGPAEFVEWEHYATLWTGLVRWLAAGRA
jgi:uncharacterized membrane protein